jgi:multidrug efflux pump
LLETVLKGKRSIFVLLGMVAVFVLSIVFLGAFPPNVVFFPKADPNFIFTYIKMPIGTDQAYTNQITKDVEQRVMKALGTNNKMVSSVLSNVSLGAQEAGSFDVSAASHLGKVTVAFVPFEARHRESSVDYLVKIREAVKGIPGAQITVDQEQGGPPVPKPISIEIIGEDFEDLSKASTDLIRFLNDKQIAGVEELKSDLVTSKPELEVNINRERAQREGISTAQIGMEIRNAVFGKEISKLKQNNDEIPIQLRFREDQRNNINTLLNTTLSFRDMAMGGMIRQVALSSVADIKYTTTYGGIKRKNQKRVVTVSSNVLSGFNPNNVVAQVQSAARDFKNSEKVEVSFGGEQVEQQAAMAFLSRALLISIGLMFFVLVLQFNSVSKPLIILSEIIFSIAGVFLGFVIFRKDISIMMTGIGIIALGGIIVRNGILLVEFIEIMIEEGLPVREAIIEAGRTRMTPVLLTAAGTVLGLIPLAVGLNIDFVKMFTELDPHIFFGGDSVAFWGPLSWTMIYGLVFGTIITLLLVPALYLIVDKFKEKIGYPSASKFRQERHAAELLKTNEDLMIAE